MIGYALIIIGVSIVLSLFLAAVSVKALGKGVRVVRYMLLFFLIILLDMLILSMQFFGINFAEPYLYYVWSLSDLFILLIFYAGIMRGNLK
ncbi:MAG: hypothetical protein M1535_05880 [Candidatus Thermoplasmatota archaeon]|jgi:hypothetical protein|nr:hypothetical protein [Candidatus Thermoplasmatota archaeon]